MCKVAVVIPFYTNEIDEYEEASMKQCMKVLKAYDIFMLTPENFEISTSVFYKNLCVRTLPRENFVNIKSYNRMMLSKEVYELFSDYDYMLIYQLDAFVFSDRLLEFCQMDYDYIGAPWMKGVVNYSKEIKPLFVGNGGFSLRKIHSFIHYLKNNHITNYSVQEDLFWAGLIDNEFKIPPIEIAASFALEGSVRYGIEMNGGQLPFGCHAWQVYSFEFWKEQLHKLGYNFTTKSNVTACDESKMVDYRFLNLDVDSLLSVFSVFEKKSNIFIWGAGRLGKELGYLFERIGLEFLYIDGDSNKWGKALQGKEIYSSDILRTVDAENTVCVLAFYKNSQKEISLLNEMGYRENNNLFFYKFIRDSLMQKVAARER